MKDIPNNQTVLTQKGIAPVTEEQMRESSIFPMSSDDDR